MKSILGSRKHHYLMKLSIFLITAALLAAMTGCPGSYTPPSQDLEIRTWYDLNATRDNLAGHHTLMNDLNSTTPGYEELAGPTANNGTGWEPIGWGHWSSGPSWLRLFGEFFKGSFDGQGHEIHDLFINSSYISVEAGLFGCVGEGGSIRNLGVVNATVAASEDIEGLARLNQDTVNSLDVAPIFAVGILVGFSMGTVSNSYASGTINCFYNVGGFLGQNAGTVNNCYSTANVTGTAGVGGLVGANGALTYGGTVSNSYSTGNVTGNASVGGLVGDDHDGIVGNSFWDIETSGQATSAGGTGKNTTQMQDITTFLGATWNITAVANFSTRDPASIWNIVNNVTYPFLSWQAV